MNAFAEHVAAHNAVCELANLTRGDLPAFELLTDCSAAELQTSIEHTIRRLRHSHLTIPNLSWELANVLRRLRGVLRSEHPGDPAGMGEFHAHLREVCLVLKSQGHSSDVLVALIAAGHTSDLAREARDVLDLD